MRSVARGTEFLGLSLLIAMIASVMLGGAVSASAGAENAGSVGGAGPVENAGPIENDRHTISSLGDKEMHSIMQKLFDRSVTKKDEARILELAETGDETWQKHVLMGAYNEYYGLVDQADEEYEAAYSVEQKNPEPLFALIRWKIQNKQLQRAELLAQLATQRYPKLPYGWRLLAVLSLRNANNTQAKRCMGKIMQLSLSTADDTTRKILQLITDRNFPKALALAKDYSAKNPESQVAQMLLATVLMQSGHSDDAVASLKIAFRKSPLKSNLLNQLYAQMLVQKNRMSEAVEPMLAIAAMETMRQPHQQLPAETSKYLTGVFRRLPQSRIDEAADFIGKHISGNGMKAAFHFMIGDLYARTQKGLAALNHYRRGVEFVPDDAQAHLRLAQYMETKVYRLDDAEIEYKKVVSLLPAEQTKNIEARIELIERHKINDFAKSWKQGLRQLLAFAIA